MLRRKEDILIIIWNSANTLIVDSWTNKIALIIRILELLKY